MTQTQCYRVTLATTNAMGNYAVTNGKYINVDNGIIYVFADNVQEAAKMIPEALAIVHVGIGYKSNLVCD